MSLFLERGSVMVMVLWVLAVLTMIGGYFAVEARISRNLGVRAWTDLQTRLVVHSLMMLLSNRLAAPDADENEIVEKGLFVVDGRRYQMEIGGQKVIFALEEENGKLDLNNAGEDQIRDLIRALFPDDDVIKADTIVDSILDWRDSDKLVRLNGAEDAAYEDKKPPYMPANGPFRVIEELLLINGVDSGIFWGPVEYVSQNEADDDSGTIWKGGLVDLFTVYSSSKNVLKKYAPLPIQETLADSLADQEQQPDIVRLSVIVGSEKVILFWKPQKGNPPYKLLHWMTGFTFDEGQRQAWAEKR